jgi:hypothetical protein
MKRCIVFYAGLIYGEYDYWQTPSESELPDGAYISFCHPMGNPKASRTWYVVTSAAAAVLHINEVPKELQTMVLLMQ